MDLKHEKNYTVNQNKNLIFQDLRYKQNIVNLVAPLQDKFWKFATEEWANEEITVDNVEEMAENAALKYCGVLHSTGAPGFALSDK